MKSEQILKLAIKKAIKNGWPSEISGVLKSPSGRELLDIAIYNSLQQENGYFYFIFSHDFAKAFWGTKSADMAIIYPKANKNLKLELKHFKPIKDWKLWEYHLINMVLEKDLIKYLEQFL